MVNYSWLDDQIPNMSKEQLIHEVDVIANKVRLMFKAIDTHRDPGKTLIPPPYTEEELIMEQDYLNSLLDEMYRRGY